MLTWDVIHTVLSLLGVSNWSGFHQCPKEFIFSFENGPDIEMVSSASEFLGDTLNIWDNDCALVCCF
jgi:hypothetical protein